METSNTVKTPYYKWVYKKWYIVGYIVEQIKTKQIMEAKLIMMECTFNLYSEDSRKTILSISDVSVLENGTKYLTLNQ